MRGTGEPRIGGGQALYQPPWIRDRRALSLSGWTRETWARHIDNCMYVTQDGFAYPPRGLPPVRAGKDCAGFPNFGRASRLAFFVGLTGFYSSNRSLFRLLDTGLRKYEHNSLCIKIGGTRKKQWPHIKRFVSARQAGGSHISQSCSYCSSVESGPASPYY